MGLDHRLGRTPVATDEGAREAHRCRRRDHHPLHRATPTGEPVLSVTNPRSLDPLSTDAPAPTAWRPDDRAPAKVSPCRSGGRWPTPGVQNVHLHGTNQRRDLLHETTMMFAKSYDLIVVKDLNVKGVLKNAHWPRTSATPVGVSSCACRLQDQAVRLGTRADRPVLPLYQELFSLRLGESQVGPQRAGVSLRDLWPLDRTRPQRRDQLGRVAQRVRPRGDTSWLDAEGRSDRVVRTSTNRLTPQKRLHRGTDPRRCLGETSAQNSVMVTYSPHAFAHTLFAEGGYHVLLP